MSTAQGLYLVNEMLKEEWIYCGGENWRQQVTDWNAGTKHAQIHHWNYYLLKRESTVLPPIPIKQLRCVCHHEIFWNEYLMSPDKKEIRIVGNCCIKKFTGNKLRTCSVCGDPHRNRKFDLCDEHKLAFIAAEKSVKRIAKQVIKAMNKFLPTIEDRIDEGIECYLSKPIYLNVPYKDKERCKLYGCKWSTKHIKWYCHEESISRIVREQVKWCQPSYKFINVQYVDYVYE